MHGCVQREARCSTLKSPRQNGDAHSPETESTKCDSPETSSTASDSPTPTNSVQEKALSIIELLREFMNDEQCQLLGTEEESSDRHSSDSDHDSSDDGLWTITPEQREYYCAQFRTLQPDPKGLLAGEDARRFFLKSKLPLYQLRKIWQLADVTKDGALSLEEFNTAMHLVVLRRNDIELPDRLPPTLVPNVSTAAPPPPPLPPTAPAASTTAAPQTTNTNATAPLDKSGSEESLASVSSLLCETCSPVGEREAAVNVSKDTSKKLPAFTSSNPKTSKEKTAGMTWTTFVDSPTSSTSPVNFDFHKAAVEQDPKILHPVALRLTPEAQSLVPQIDESSRMNSEDSGFDATDGAVVAAPDIRPIQRPQPKKPAVFLETAKDNLARRSTSGTLSRRAIRKYVDLLVPGPGAIPPPPQTAVFPAAEEISATTQVGNFQTSGPTSLPMGLKKDPPPPPPPRPYRTHTRSSSLDLNKLGKGNLGTPPTVPPRISPNTMSPKMLVGQLSEGDATAQLRFADFTQFENLAETDIVAPRKHGAFEVYRKPTPKNNSNENTTENEEDNAQSSKQTPMSSGDSNRLLRIQEQNAALSRVCQELAAELTELQQERAELEVRLEQVWNLQSHAYQNSSQTNKHTSSLPH